MAQAQKLTNAQMRQAFGVSHMALLHWRAGTPTKDPLPAHVENPDAGKSPVYFKETEVRRWAKKHGVEFAVDPTDILSGKVKAEVKPVAKKAAKKTKPVVKKSSTPAKRAPRKPAVEVAAAA